MPKITPERLSFIFTSGGAAYPLYKESVDEFDKLRIHADGVFPESMLAKRRPSETDEILKYRKEVYKPITQHPLSKVLTSLGKIRRSEDWTINFPSEKRTSRIPEEESIEMYCKEKIPGVKSIESWAFGVLLRQMLIDPNAVVTVIPVKAITTDEFALPVPLLFNSDQVMHFDEIEKYAVFKSKRKLNYLDNLGQIQAGDIFYYVDDREIIIYEFKNGQYEVTFEAVNTTGQFPAFKVSAESFKQFDNMTLNRSRLHAMIPFLDEAVAEYSDLKGSKIQHLYPLFWYFETNECKPCNGLGRVTDEKTHKSEKCTECGGRGKVQFSPFAHMVVEPAGLGEQAIPNPPAGYITRDTAILELQEKSVEKHLLRALSAVNMQFLDQTPLSISGDAKQVDREELNNFVYNIAEDLIEGIDKAIYLINEWRYGFLIPDPKARKEMLPTIAVPQQYDLLPENYLMKEVADARTAKISPLLIGTLEQQYAAKKFYNVPQLSEQVKLWFDLDPLPGMSIDEKMTLLSNKGCTHADYVLSSYLPAFIKRAVRENRGFEALEYTKQMEILMGYVDEKMTELDESSKMIESERERVLREMQNQGA